MARPVASVTWLPLPSMLTVTLSSGPVEPATVTAMIELVMALPANNTEAVPPAVTAAARVVLSKAIPLSYPPIVTMCDPAVMFVKVKAEAVPTVVEGS